MKKKILLGIIILIGLFTITGCEKNDNTSNETSNSNEFKVKNVSLKFDKDTQFGNFHYKNAEGLEPDESKQAVYLEYENKEIYDGRFVFRISMAYTDETTLDKFLEGKKTTTEKINGINWKMLSIDSISNNKETTSINYVTEKKGTIYVVSIVSFKESNVDTTKLAKIFINGVTIK